MAPAPLRLHAVRAVTVAAAAAAPFVIAAPAPAAPAPDPPAPACGTPDGGGFPLDTRIHGGPAGFPAGGPFQELKLDLTNTTDAPCSGVHPVLVLTDRDRALRPEQIRFEFYDAGSARWHPVAFEPTEDAENVGVFTGPDGPGGFGGFSVPAGRTLTVPVRLTFEVETAPDEVVVNAAVVQRRGEDGDWVGESGDYLLTVGPAAPAAPVTPTAPDTPRPPGPSAPPGKEPRPPAPTAPATVRPDVAEAAEAAEGAEDAEEARELASTGRESEAHARALAPVAAGLLLLGAALVWVARRPRHR